MRKLKSGNKPVVYGALTVKVHDFVGELGKANPYGVYDLGSNSAKQNLFKAVFTFYVEKQSLQVSVAKGHISLEAIGDLIRNASCDLPRALHAMQRPSGRGTGIRRARQLTPGEASSATGPVATKFSPKIRREQLRAQELRARAEEECRA